MKTSLDPVIEAYKQGLDRTLFERPLALSIEERLRALQELVRFADELAAAGKRLRADRRAT